MAIQLDKVKLNLGSMLEMYKEDICVLREKYTFLGALHSHEVDFIKNL